MSKIARKTLIPFGSGGVVGDFEQFGSRAAGSPVYTQDPAVIQALAAWVDGWKAALISGNRAPICEDQNALDFVTGYMLGYLFQEGIPEWDAGTTYYKNSIVKKPGTMELYGSLVDSNQGNVLPSQTDDVNWKFLFPVRTSQLIGSILDSQIAAVAAAKITGQLATAQYGDLSIPDAKISSLAYSKLTGSPSVSSFGVGKTGNQVVSGNTVVLVKMNNEFWDELGEFNPSTYLFTAQATGRYEYFLRHVAYGDIASGDAAFVRISKNGAPVAVGQILGDMIICGPYISASHPCLAGIVQLNAGDNVGLYTNWTYQGHDWTIGGTPSQEYGMRFEMRRVS